MNWENQHHSQGGTLSIDWNSLTFRFKKPSLTLAQQRDALQRGNGANGTSVDRFTEGTLQQ
jgi:hypothetical protein